MRPWKRQLALETAPMGPSRQVHASDNGQNKIPLKRDMPAHCHEQGAQHVSHRLRVRGGTMSDKELDCVVDISGVIGVFHVLCAKAPQDRRQIALSREKQRKNHRFLEDVALAKRGA